MEIATIHPDELNPTEYHFDPDPDQERDELDLDVAFLIDEIETHGYLTKWPIIHYRGDIIDGHHRQAAALWLTRNTDTEIRVTAIDISQFGVEGDESHDAARQLTDDQFDEIGLASEIVGCP